MQLRRELDRHRGTEAQLRQQTQRFRALRQIIDAGAATPLPKSQSAASTASESDLLSAAAPAPTPALKPTASDPRLTSVQKAAAASVASPSLRGPALSARKRRSRSADAGERWLDHRPATTLELDTVMQPQLGHAKSITKLVDPRAMTKGKCSKYILTTQEQVRLLLLPLLRLVFFFLLQSQLTIP